MGEKSTKADRNRPGCQAYAAAQRREINKAKRLLRHIGRYGEADAVAVAAINGLPATVRRTVLGSVTDIKAYPTLAARIPAARPMARKAKAPQQHDNGKATAIVTSSGTLKAFDEELRRWRFKQLAQKPAASQVLDICAHAAAADKSDPFAAARAISRLTSGVASPEDYATQRWQSMFSLGEYIPTAA